MTKLTIEGDPGVASLLVLPQFLCGDLEEPAAGPGEVLPRLGQPDPLHERESGLEGNFVSGVSCQQRLIRHSVDHNNCFLFHEYYGGKGHTVRPRQDCLTFTTA